MACTARTFKASPDQIWAVLADPCTYEHWVVGTKDVRTADGTWPEQGSTLQHTTGLGPLNLKDNTKVIESDPLRRLVLEARGRPLGIARVEIELKPQGSSTVVTITEFAVRPELAKRLNPMLNPLLHTRNLEALRRLEDLTLERVGTPT